MGHSGLYWPMVVLQSEVILGVLLSDILVSTGQWGCYSAK